MSKKTTEDVLPAVDNTNPNTALEMMAAILAEMRADRQKATPDAIETLAKGIQELVGAENRKTKENQSPPEISDFNPLGELAHPRPELRCKMSWVGHKLSKEGLSREEIELLNRIEPGSYRVTKADGSCIKFDVSSVNDNAGRLERMSFHFPCKAADDRHNHAPMASYLKEALGEAKPRVDQLMREVESLRAELAAKGV